MDDDKREEEKLQTENTEAERYFVNKEKFLQSVIYVKSVPVWMMQLIPD